MKTTKNASLLYIASSQHKSEIYNHST